MPPEIGLFLAVLCCMACGGIGFAMGHSFGSTKHYHHYQVNNDGAIRETNQQREAENVETHLPGRRYQNRYL